MDSTCKACTERWSPTRTNTNSHCFCSKLKRTKSLEPSSMKPSESTSRATQAPVTASSSVLSPPWKCGMISKSTIDTYWESKTTSLLVVMGMDPLSGLMRHWKGARRIPAQRSLTSYSMEEKKAKTSNSTFIISNSTSSELIDILILQCLFI